jgi:hypothetical protein
MRHKLYEEEYTQADVLSTIENLKGNNATVAQDAVENNSLRDEVLSYIKELEGFRIRLREIHWQTERHSEHKLTDDLISEFESHEDSVAEIVMGLLGVRIQVGEVVPELPAEKDLKGLLQHALNSAFHLKSKLTSAPGYSGLESLIDDFMQCISKGKYLQTLA